MIGNMDMRIGEQPDIRNSNTIDSAGNVNENKVAVFQEKLEAFQNAYQMHNQTVYKNRKVSVSEYGMEGKTGVKAFFQKTKNLCHNIAVAFRSGNENKANDAADIIKQSVTDLKNAADALKPEDYDTLLKAQTFGGTIRNLDDARKQIKDHINLVKGYKDTGNFAARLNQSLTDIGNIEKNLYNGFFNSALKLADFMLNEAFDSLGKYEKKPLGNDFSRNVDTLYKAKQVISNSRFIQECRLNGNMDGALKDTDSDNILNSLHSASRIMEKRQNGELVTIGDITAEFRRFAETVPDRTRETAQKLDDLYGQLYEKYSSGLKKIQEYLDNDEFPSDEEIQTARQNLSVNDNLMPLKVHKFFETLAPTEIKTPQTVMEKIALSQEEIDDAAAEMARKMTDEWYKSLKK